MRALWGVAVLAGCYGPKIAPGSPCDSDHPCPTELTCTAGTCQGSAALPIDAAIDSSGDGAPPCYGAGLVRECFAAPPTGVIKISGTTTIDTATSSMCLLQGGACVVAADRITIDSGAELIATGANPLVLVAASAIDVTGEIDAASHETNGRDGAGANPSDCVTYTNPNYPTGGPGGSFGGRGGTGGAASLVGLGHASAPTIAATTLRGGCPGSDGNTGGMNGGSGGGALYLIAAGTITVTGKINASGAGGGGGMTGASATGGGGGGAGGMIGLDAPTILVGGVAQVFANGGGGGEGGDAAATGAAGADPSAAITPAPGGTGSSSNGGAGGAGSSGTTLAGSNGAGLNTGGGGGGGAGVILVFPKQQLGGAVSPPPT